MKKVCIYTSTRAEWGILHGLAEIIKDTAELSLQILASGTHLSPDFGMTVSEIEDNGFTVDERIDILKFDDSPIGICKTMGLALSEYGPALERLRPDLIIILGDRYEAFCAATAAHVCRIPIAHLHGGEKTEGVADEAYRHSITKMAHLHFASCEDYRQRIIQLGENPECVHNVGAMGVENITHANLLDKEQLANSIEFPLDSPFFVVTFHPVTLEQDTAAEQFKALERSLDRFPGHKVIITKANADAEGNIINQLIDEYAANNPERCLGVDSLGALRYLSAVQHADAVIGNSSSGIIEVPSLKTPTINIGDRQRGRIQAESIINCEPNQDAIESAITQALQDEFRRSLLTTQNPYEQKNTAQQITDVLLSSELKLDILKKVFYDLS